MTSENRHNTILREIEDRGSVRVLDLARRLDVSEMTIRRDLADLEKAGSIKRVHGGAVSARGRSYEPPLMLRAAENLAAKQKIAKLAASLVADGDSLALDIGTTTLELASYLAERRNLTVVTSSLHIANRLFAQPDIRLIVSGGIVRPGEASLVGDLAQRTYADLYVDRLFLGVGAVEANAGLTEYNWDDALVKQAMIRSAKEVILLVDASKFDRIAFARVAPLAAIHQLVTDRLPGEEILKICDQLGVVVHVADEPDGQKTTQKG
jgi:DeoR/GlpR family transcriptional regulator of sugar metabolism